jgi:hypothetical protein
VVVQLLCGLRGCASHAPVPATRRGRRSSVAPRRPLRTLTLGGVFLYSSTKVRAIVLMSALTLAMVVVARTRTAAAWANPSRGRAAAAFADASAARREAAPAAASQRDRWPTELT